MPFPETKQTIPAFELKAGDQIVDRLDGSTREVLTVEKRTDSVSVELPVLGQVDFDPTQKVDVIRE
ncbi:MAG: hypothetical protein Q8P13_02625 [bacterium]|nr:hypothetical protein [bacterium]